VSVAVTFLLAPAAAFGADLPDKGEQLIEKHQFKEALAFYNSKLKDHANDAEAYTAKAEALIGLGKFEQAVDAATAALKIAEDEEAYCQRAFAYIELEKPSLALLDCSKALSLNPKSSEAYRIRGEVEAEQDQYKKALEDCSIALKLDPKNADAFRVRATVCVALEEYERALSDCQKAIALDPLLGEVYFVQSQAYSELGKKDLAQQARKKAKELGYKE